MNTTSIEKRTGYLVIGGIGLVLALAYLGLAFQISFGQLDQPGPGIFPVLVGVILTLASLATMWEGWQMEKAELVDFPAGADRKRILSLVALLFGYFLLLPWLGQIIAGTLFCIFLMRVLSSLGWLRIVVYSLLMSIAIYVMFVRLLKVPMPSGVLAF
jgi:putative tricarboxylic transport membrane protein